MASAVASVEYKSKKLNFIDTPGLFDFEQGAFEGLRAAETAVIVVSARSGLAVGAEKAFKNAGSRRMARVLVTTKWTTIVRISTRALTHCGQVRHGGLPGGSAHHLRRQGGCLLQYD